MKRKLIKGDSFYFHLTISSEKIAYLFDNLYAAASEWYSKEVVDDVKYLRIVLEIIE